MLYTIAGGEIAGHPVSQGAGETIALVFIGFIALMILRAIARSARRAS